MVTVEQPDGDGTLTVVTTDLGFLGVNAEVRVLTGVGDKLGSFDGANSLVLILAVASGRYSLEISLKNDQPWEEGILVFWWCDCKGQYHPERLLMPREVHLRNCPSGLPIPPTPSSSTSQTRP